MWPWQAFNWGVFWAVLVVLAGWKALKLTVRFADSRMGGSSVWERPIYGVQQLRMIRELLESIATKLGVPVEYK